MITVARMVSVNVQKNWISAINKTIYGGDIPFSYGAKCPSSCSQEITTGPVVS
jgi:hypothetical protein